MTLSLPARLVAAVFALFALGLSQAGAATLTADQTQRFIASLSAANDFGRQLENKDFLENEDANELIINGKFAPYTAALNMLQARNSSAVSQLSGIVKKTGFSSASQWAAIGDKVMLAYMALNSTGMSAALGQMTPQMMAMMPPHVQEQMKAAKIMMQTIDGVPQADRDVVRGFLPQLEQAMGDSVPSANPMGR